MASTASLTLPAWTVAYVQRGCSGRPHAADWLNLGPPAGGTKIEGPDWLQLAHRRGRAPTVLVCGSHGLHFVVAWQPLFWNYLISHIAHIVRKLDHIQYSNKGLSLVAQDVYS